MQDFAFFSIQKIQVDVEKIWARPYLGGLIQAHRNQLSWNRNCCLFYWFDRLIMKQKELAGSK